VTTEFDMNLPALAASPTLNLPTADDET